MKETTIEIVRLAGIDDNLEKRKIENLLVSWGLGG
jgi:hypothetical protein